jgi:hypothetical protein
MALTKAKLINTINSVDRHGILIELKLAMGKILRTWANTAKRYPAFSRDKGVSLQIECLATMARFSKIDTNISNRLADFLCLNGT